MHHAHQYIHDITQRFHVESFYFWGFCARFAFLGWPSRIIEDEGIHRNILAAMFLTGITLVALEAWTSKTELQELLVGV